MVLDEADIDRLFIQVDATPGYRLRVDLESQSVTAPDGTVMRFEIDADRKYRLLNGLDAIGLTLRHADDISAYEARRRGEAPWLFMDTADLSTRVGGDRENER
jgi:3-isopropylmalate/(R)-2-methylmalate dehydratase small subunit